MKNGKTFLLILSIQLLSHLPFLNHPPCGSHLWRQCNTLALSRNFYMENMNILEPRIDRRNETNGITGSHFPLYEWGLASIYKITGEHYWVQRLYALLIFSVGIYAFYLLLMGFKFECMQSLFGALLLGGLPQLYYDGLNALPDIAALSLSILSVLFYHRYIQSGLTNNLILGAIFTALAGLTKIQFMMAPMAFSLFCGINTAKFRLYLFSLVLAIIPVAAWYYYAGILTEMNNLREYGLWIKPIGVERTMETIFKNLLSDVPELLLGWPLLLFFIILIFKSGWRKVKYNYLPYLAWFLGFVVFYLVMRERFYDHSYYFISLLPLCILIFMQVFKTSGMKTRILALLMVSNLSWSMVRIIPSQWTESGKRLSSYFSDKHRLEKIKAQMPRDKTCIVGPDLSGCIYFYFLEVKGFSFAEPDEILEINSGINKLEEYHQKGAEYLIVSDKKAMENRIRQAGKWVLYSEVDEFAIWRHE